MKEIKKNLRRGQTLVIGLGTMFAGYLTIVGGKCATLTK